MDPNDTRMPPPSPAWQENHPGTPIPGWAGFTEHARDQVPGGGAFVIHATDDHGTEGFFPGILRDGTEHLGTFILGGGKSSYLDALERARKLAPLTSPRLPRPQQGCFSLRKTSLTLTLRHPLASAMVRSTSHPRLRGGRRGSGPSHSRGT
jgi:hypothetical protein